MFYFILGLEFVFHEDKDYFYFIHHCISKECFSDKHIC
jgi:hypothetical protein